MEAAKVRVRNTERGDLALGAAQRTRLIGISSQLTLGGEEPVISTFHAESRGSRWVEGSKPGCPCAKDGGASHDGQVTLKTTCAELDTLTLRLVQREAGNTSSSSSSSGLGLEQQRQGRGGDAVMVAVSDVNDVFDGRWQWVTMRHDFVGETFDRQKGRHPAGGKAGEFGRGEGGAECRLEVLLRLSVADAVPITHPREYHRTLSTVGQSSAEGPIPPHKSEYLSGPLPNKENLRVIEPPRSGDAPRSALEAWVTSPDNGCAQAVAVVPPQGTSSSGSATAHPKRGTTLNDKAGSTPDYPGQAGPGVLEVEVLAIHGRRQEPWPATNHDNNSCGGERKSGSLKRSSPPWWVRVTCSSGPTSTDSPPGKLTLLEGSQARGGGIGAAVAAPLSHHQDAAEGLGFDWTVHWPPRGGVLAKYPVHWTPSQSSLPVASFEVFRGQVRFT